MKPFHYVDSYAIKEIVTGVKMKMLYKDKNVLSVFFLFFLHKKWIVKLVRSAIQWHAYATNNFYSRKMSILGKFVIFVI